jgi:hypothetical protein
MSNRVYPVFRGLAFSVTKTPNWASRMQRAVSGRMLRTSDYVNPIWTFKLIYAILHDYPWCSYTSPTELRAMMDFFNSSGGAFDTFLLTDPSDNTVTGQVLPGAISSVSSFALADGGSGYQVGDGVGTYFQGVLSPGGPDAQWQVTSISGGGSTGPITGLTLINPGSYAVAPSSPANLVDGSGSGATINVVWTTTVQLIRQLVPGGFAEAIIAPNNVSAIYFDTGSGPVPQLGWSVDPTTGLVTLPSAFTMTQPTITADFTYYFRVYFPDALDFEEIYSQMWQLRQVKLTSVVL